MPVSLGAKVESSSVERSRPAACNFTPARYPFTGVDFATD